MYGLAHRALHLLQDRDAQIEDDVGDSKRSRQPRKIARSRKPTSWTWVMAQLLDLLRQYPGGLAESALMTEILARRIRKQGKPDCADAGAWNSGADDNIHGRSSVAAGSTLAISLGVTQLPGLAPAVTAYGSAIANGKSGSACGSNSGGFLPGQISLSALSKAQRPARPTEPSSLSPVVVASVACVECLHPPHGSGPAFETAGGSWLLQLEEGGAVSPSATQGDGVAAPGSLGSVPGVAVGGPLPSAAAAVPMYLHSELRLMVMGRTPLLAAGRRVRVAGVPPRSAAAATSPLAARLLPTRYLVPELPSALVAGGSWPHFDGLRHGGTDPMLLSSANTGAMGAVAPGSRAAVTGWVLARVAAVGAAPPREPGAFDRHRRRLVHLVDAEPHAAAAATSTTTLILYGEAVALGDLLLPGEAIAMYQPTVHVHELMAAIPGAVQRELLSYEHGPDTILAVLPPGWGQAPGAGSAAPMDVDGRTDRPGAAGAAGATSGGWPQAEIATAGERPDVAAAADSKRIAAPSQEPRHALLGLASLGPRGATLGAIASCSIGGGGGAGAGAIATTRATAITTADCMGPGTEGCRTAIVARVQALLGYSHGAGTTHGGRLRAVLSDGTAAVAAELQLARGSKVLSHVREGHVIVLLGAVYLPPTSAASSALAASAAAALLDSHAPPPAPGAGGSAGLHGDGGGGCLHSAASAAPACSPIACQIQALAWTETAVGSEAYSLTAMPAHVTTPPLVSYTSLAALRLAHHQLMQQRVLQQRQLRGGQGPFQPQQQHGHNHNHQQSPQDPQHHHQWQHPPHASDNGAVTVLRWPADMLRALAAATHQLSDLRGAWGRDVPYLQQPFHLADCAQVPSALPASAGGFYDAAGGRGGGEMMQGPTGAPGGRRSPPGGQSRGTTGCMTHGPVLAPSPPAAAAAGLPTAVPAGAGVAPTVEGTKECSPDRWCGALACVVVARAAHVATHRVHRQCGRPVKRAASMYDFDDMDDDGAGGGDGGGAVTEGGGGGEGGGGAGLSLPEGSAPASNPVLDTPSKDQSMDGLWECAFCGLDLVKGDLQWQYHGSLTMQDVCGNAAPAAAAAGAVAGPPGTAALCSSATSQAGAVTTDTVTLPADPEALHSLLGVSAAAFHSLGTSRRRRVVESCLVDRRGVPRRCVAALYPKPWRPHQHHPQRDGPVAALSFGACVGATAGSGAGVPAAAGTAGSGGGCQLDDCWAVAQLHPVD